MTTEQGSTLHHDSPPDYNDGVRVHNLIVLMPTGLPTPLSWIMPIIVWLGYPALLLACHMMMPADEAGVEKALVAPFLYIPVMAATAMIVLPRRFHFVGNSENAHSMTDDSHFQGSLDGFGRELNRPQ